MQVLRRHERAQVSTAGGFLLEGSLVIWSVSMEQRASRKAEESARRRQSSRGGWIVSDSPEADAQPAISWWSYICSPIRSSLTEDNGRLIWIRAGTVDGASLALGQATTSLTSPAIVPALGGSSSCLVASERLTSEVMGSIDLVVIVAGTEGLPWKEWEDGYGQIDGRWPLSSLGSKNDEYWIGVFGCSDPASVSEPSSS